MKQKPLNTPREKFTIIDNLVLDKLMPTMSGNEFKILMLIIRSTIGWQKEEDQLSYSQIQKRTGIKSKTTIGSCLNSLKEKQYIIEIRHNDQWEANTYALNTEFEIDTSPVSKNGHTKESIKENKTNKDIAAYGAPPPPETFEVEKPFPNGKQANGSLSGASNGVNVSVPPAKSKPAKKEPSLHQQLMKAYQDVLGYPIPNGAKEGKGAKKILSAGYTIEQVVDCYRQTKKDDWWKDKHLSLMSLCERLGPFVKQQNGRTDYATMDIEAENERMNAHLPPLPSLEELL